MEPTPARPTVFISYSHADERWKDRLVKQLQVLALEGAWDLWDDRRIAAGDDWRPEIEAAMARARAAVLLISADFLTSGFIRGTEVPELLRRRQEEGLLVIPVIVHPCPWLSVLWLSKIQCRPKDGKELDSFTRPKAEKHLATLAGELRDLLNSPSPPPGTSLSGSSARKENSPGGEVGPPLHNLPHPPLGPLFTGRQEELDALESGETAAITQSEAISGLGGIGKTRLAVEYAWRCGSRYTAAWFVRADSPEGLYRNLAALAHPELLNLLEWEAQVEEKTIAAVKRWLREHPGWLMILDNVDTPEAQEAVLQILPALSKGRVLITSRLRNWPASVQKQSLEKLSAPKATQFLLHRTENGREKAHDDAARAADLAGVLDGLPLALEQAAAYVVRQQMSFAEYLKAWEEERSEVLKWHHPGVMQYPASVAVTWKQTFDQLSPTAASLLRLMSFLAPEPIPMSLLEQGSEYIEEATALFCEETGKETESQTIRAAISDLADYSMVSRQDGGAVTVHRMVQEALKDRIPEEHTRTWIETALWIVNGAAVGQSWDVRTWPVWDWLRPHVAKIVAVADEAGISDPTSGLMINLGVLLKEKSLYSEAEPLMRRALAIDETAFGSDHPNTTTSLGNLAQLLHDMDRLDEAEPLIRRALAIDELTFGNDYPKVAIHLNVLARLLQATDRLDEAEPLIRRALAIDEAAFGNDYPRVSIHLNNLASLLQAMKRLEEAEPLIRRSLAIAEASLGKDHPKVAIRTNNLVALLYATNRLEEAEPLMRSAVEILEKSLGLDHPDTQMAQEHLKILLAAIDSSAPRRDSPS